MWLTQVYTPATVSVMCLFASPPTARWKVAPWRHDADRRAPSLLVGTHDITCRLSRGKLILVGGLEHFLFSHILRIIIPTDFHIFQRGRSTTNQIIINHHQNHHQNHHHNHYIILTID